MKVISNSILFVYSLRGALIKIARGYHTQGGNFFDRTTPLLEMVRTHLVAFSYAYRKRNSNLHTCTNPRPGQYLTDAQSHVTRALLSWVSGLPKGLGEGRFFPLFPQKRQILRLGVGRQLSRSRGVLIRDHQNMKYQVHSDKPLKQNGIAVWPRNRWQSWNSFNSVLMKDRLPILLKGSHLKG